jgi:hypothetical protein
MSWMSFQYADLKGRRRAGNNERGPGNKKGYFSLRISRRPILFTFEILYIRLDSL